MSQIRNLNTLSLGAGLNITSGEPIDSRIKVNNITDIYDSRNWDFVKPYKGLIVSDNFGNACICLNDSRKIINTGEERKPEYCLESSWKPLQEKFVNETIKRTLSWCIIDEDIPIEEIKVIDPYSDNLDENTDNLTLNDQKVLQANVLPENATQSKDVIWSSTNNHILSIISYFDNTCIVEANYPGDAAIVAISEANKSIKGRYNIHVPEPPQVPIPITEIDIINDLGESLGDEFYLYYISDNDNNSLTLSAKVLPENTTQSKDVIWESSDNNVASINMNTGYVEIFNQGSTTITVKSVVNSNIKRTFVLLVTIKSPSSPGDTPGNIVTTSINPDPTESPETSDPPTTN